MTRRYDVTQVRRHPDGTLYTHLIRVRRRVTRYHVLARDLAYAIARRMARNGHGPTQVCNRRMEVERCYWPDGTCHVYSIWHGDYWLDASGRRAA